MTKLKKVFEKYPNYECLVIACTAAASESEKDKALGAGMKDFCTKKDYIIERRYLCP